MHFRTRQLTVSLITMGLLYACGGGGGGGSTSSSSLYLSGVAATGAAFTDATITVTDRTGTVVGTGTVASDGTYTVTLSASAEAPFVLKASRTNAEGATESLVSVVPSMSGTSATVNVTPVTNLIAARLSPSGDPAQLATELAAGTATITSTTVNTSVQDVQTILAPVLAATGTTATDPLYGTFQTNGTGYDQLLDSLKVTIIPTSTTSSNIEIGVKQQQADGTQPVVVQFSSTDPVSTVTTNNNITSTAIGGTTISSANLVPSGTAQLIADHLAQLNACYALPLASRVNTTPTNDLATGSAANVVATECRNAFYNNDPSTFLSNGDSVGRNSNNQGAFASLFRDGATGVVFSQGTYEFTRNNGDIVVGYKTRDTLGNEAYDAFVVRLDSDGKLKQIGNQYQYAGGISPYQQLREFLAQPNSNYYSTGYNVNIPLINSPQVINHVDITTPRGNVIRMVRGSDSMVLPKPGGAASGTNFIRVRSEYVDAANAPANHPRHSTSADTNLFFVGGQAGTDFTEAQVSGIPNQSVWKFEYFTGGTVGTIGSGTLQATQYYKTRTRASTITELRTQAWADLDSATKAGLQTLCASTCASTSGYMALPASQNMSPGWTVPTGALPPTQIKLFGNALWYNGGTPAFPGNQVYPVTVTSVTYGGARSAFNDGQKVASTARSGTIACANGATDANGYGEKHCNLAGGPGYAATARGTGLHLFAQDATGRQYARFFAPYNLF